MEWFLQNVEGPTRWLSLYRYLEDASKSRRIFGKVPDRKEIVRSRNVKAFLKSAFHEFPGQTTVCYGVSGCGKTTSGMYLSRGDYAHRPDRAFMIEAEGSLDFATSFAKQMSAPLAAPHIASILVASVRPSSETETKSTAEKLMGSISEMIQRMNCFLPSVGVPANLIAHPPFALNLDPSYKLGPRIIIDDLPQSEANREFVGRLYTAAFAATVNVLILTKDREWANEMIAINGGVKILPMEEVIDNPRERASAQFKEIPGWTGMFWDDKDI